MDWEFIKQFHMNPPNFQLKRSIETQKKYDNYKKENFNIDFFKKELFKNNCNWIVKKNNFPYNLDKNIEHYLVWFKDEKFINYKLINFLFRDYKFICFENTLNFRSIDKIRHIHVFVKLI